MLVLDAGSSTEELVCDLVKTDLRIPKPYEALSCVGSDELSTGTARE